ncbi:LysR family transcriptional regulator [Amycolatopsis rubida]|uniref:DNA-binding transcriptional regulator, LysR family n=1 Tax=Amycolatopsis rubida TaxID=112413 RepID=A0A1I5ZWH9_9PSEU|nr:MULTISPECIES: LysR family transcriptional regulator [Amycolatopsis]MYW89699.1 LysR family transcriptional regulator [Amycolatopsis rubida]NEC54675.1 LysR family transcriptional regulator [Amycolatopsis rubida]OAP20585.1 HTH-type transcriptional regulator GltC [Amycolatopsis sp. M39]SFQ60824.1 DNA-binding transcriptional regulator, LysR family [Amycolatopsis rubida]
MELSLHRLRMLRELHRRGTVTAAAAALHYTASAVSQQLAQLERDVGAKLFERLGRRVQLTELGILLTEHAEEILGSVERATLALEEAQGSMSARLTAGVWASVASGLLPTALTALAADYPGIQVRTKELAPEATADAVRDGTLDLSFVIDYSDAPMEWSDGLERAVVAVERLHAAVPAGALPSATVPLDALAEHPWILASAKSHFGRAIRIACQRHGFQPKINHEVEEQSTAMAMVGAGLGVTLVSDLGLRLLRPPGIDVVALAPPLLRTVSIAYRRTEIRRPALHLVVAAVQEAAAELGLGTEPALP